jgi:hypothetical protein
LPIRQASGLFSRYSSLAVSTTGLFSVISLTSGPMAGRVEPSFHTLLAPSYPLDTLRRRIKRGKNGVRRITSREPSIWHLTWAYRRFRWSSLVVGRPGTRTLPAGSKVRSSGCFRLLAAPCRMVHHSQVTHAISFRSSCHHFFGIVSRASRNRVSGTEHVVGLVGSTGAASGAQDQPDERTEAAATAT